MPQEPVFIVVSGGVVQESPSFVEVIDFDNLLPDFYSWGDSANAWNALSEEGKAYVREQYPDEYQSIAEHIAEDGKASNTESLINTPTNHSGSEPRPRAQVEPDAVDIPAAPLD